MIRNKKNEMFKPFPSTIGRVFTVLAAAAILLIGWNQSAEGQTELSSTANPPVVTSKPINDTLKASSTEPQDAPQSAAGNSLAVPSGVSEKWNERYEKLTDDILKGRKNQEDADTFYQELSAALRDTRNRLRDVLAALTSAPPKKDEAPQKKAPSDSPGMAPDEQEPQEVSAPARQDEDIVNLLRTAEQLQSDLTGLYKLRIQALGNVTSGLQEKVTGVGFGGNQAFKEELDHIFLIFRYRLYLFPQTSRQAADSIIGAPIPVLMVVVQLALSILVFYWWRRWAAQGIPKVRQNLLDISPRKSIHTWLVKLLWYLNRIRSPLEWFLLLVVLINIIEVYVGPLIYSLATKIRWILIAWFAVALVAAMVARGAAGLKSKNASLRLRSIWLVALWVLVVGLGLDITEDLAGEATIYAWVWTFSKVLALPVLFLLIRWWRQVIFQELEKELQQPAYVQKILQHQHGAGSYLMAVFGTVYLIGNNFRQWLLRGISSFEGGRFFIANLTRLEAVRISERQPKKRQGVPISEEMRHQLFEGDGPLVDSVGHDALERMAQMVKKRRRGAMVIVSERGGGKTQLLKRLDGKFEGKVVLFDCPPGGVNAFQKVFAEALGLKTSDLSPETISERIKENQIRVIGIDNIHRLSRPALGGQREMDQMAALITAIQENVFWFFGMDWAAWQYISRVRASRLFLDDVLRLPQWTETQIKELLELRSTHAGISPYFGELVLPRQFENIDYDTVEERNRFGFYRILWNASEGNPVVALRLWADALIIAPDGRTLVCLPQLPVTNELEKANITTLLVLRVIAQSGYATQEEIIDSLRYPATEVAGALRYAIDREWVESVDDRYNMNWKWFRSINRVLARQNFLVRKTLGGSS